MARLTLTKETAPVAWYTVKLDGVTIGHVVRSDGRIWKAWLLRMGDLVDDEKGYPGRSDRAGLVGVHRTRKDAVEDVKASYLAVFG